MEQKYQKFLRIILLAVAFHSFFVGFGLIFATNKVRILFGFQPSPEHFFQIQGGVFHIIMAIGYAMGAYNPSKYESLIIFTIIVKWFATIFLLLYYVAGSSNWLVLFSGIVDGLMALAVYYLYMRSKGRRINVKAIK